METGNVTNQGFFFRVSCEIFTSTRLTKPWDRRQKSGIMGKKYFKLRDAKYSILSCWFYLN